MRKLFALLAALVMTVSLLAACGDQPKEYPGGGVVTYLT